MRTVPADQVFIDDCLKPRRPEDFNLIEYTEPPLDKLEELGRIEQRKENLTRGGLETTIDENSGDLIHHFFSDPLQFLDFFWTGFRLRRLRSRSEPLLEELRKWAVVPDDYLPDEIWSTATTVHYTEERPGLWELERPWIQIFHWRDPEYEIHLYEKGRPYAILTGLDPEEVIREHYEEEGTSFLEEEEGYTISELADIQ